MYKGLSTACSIDRRKKQKNEDSIPMKRKLLRSASSEASSPEGVYRQGNVDEQAQQSSALELEQSTGTEGRGFLLEPRLAQALGMCHGEMIFRSMFYGTPQAYHISNLVTQLLNEQEELVRNELEEGTSSFVWPSNNGYTLALMASNEATIRALMDSIEAPPSVTVGPEEAVVEVANTTYWQTPEALAVEGVGIEHEPVPNTSEQSTMGCEGSILAPDLALDLEMQPDQVLRGGMFYNTQPGVVLEKIKRLSAIREGLLHNRELERASVTQEEIGVGLENIATLITTNEELTQALIGSIEAPTATPILIESESEEETLINERSEAKASEESQQKVEEAIPILIESESETESEEETSTKEGLEARVSNENQQKVEDNRVTKKEIDRFIDTVKAAEKAMGSVMRALIGSIKAPMATFVPTESETESEEEESLIKERLEARISEENSQRVTRNLADEEREVSEALEKVEAARNAIKALRKRKSEDLIMAKLEKLKSKETKRMLEREVRRTIRMEERRKKQTSEKKLRKEILAERERLKEERKAEESKEQERGAAIAKAMLENTREKEQKEAKKAQGEGARKARGEGARKAQEERAARRSISKMENAAIARALAEERTAKIKRELEEERAIAIRIGKLELELEKSRKLEESVEIEERAGEIAKPELELELVGVRKREQDLSIELNRVRTHATNLDREIRAGRVISGATASEIEEKKNRMKALNIGRVMAKIRVLELEIEASRARAIAKKLTIELERLKYRGK